MSVEHLQTDKPLLSFDEWKTKLIDVTVEETGILRGDIVLNEKEARQWWIDGFTPYACFRENFSR